MKLFIELRDDNNRPVSSADVMVPFRIGAFTVGLRNQIAYIALAKVQKMLEGVEVPHGEPGR